MSYLAKKFTHAGLSLTLAEWAVERKIPDDCLRYRLRMGWSLAKTLDTPSAGKKIARAWDAPADPTLNRWLRMPPPVVQPECR